MIIRLKGRIEKLLPTSVELEVAGVTYFIEISLLTSIELQNQAGIQRDDGQENKREKGEREESEKQKVTLEIAQILREDSNLLYGFITRQEREIFLRLLKVNGVGGRIALSILSSFSAPQFLGIIQTNNLASLKGIKGIGAKVASKIMLDFTGYVQGLESAPSDMGNDMKLVYEALNTLGFKDSEINMALSNLDSQVLKLESNEIIKYVLKGMGR